MKRIHVLIAEDKQTYRAELRRTLEQNDHIKVIGEAKVGGEVVTMAQQLAPDVILMDLRIEPMNGLDAIRAIMRQRASIKILVLTIEENELLLFECLRAGARGYLRKDAGAAHIIRGVEAVNEGHLDLTPALSTHVIGYFEKIRRRRESELFPQLSTREFDVLKLMAQGRKNREIAEQLDITAKSMANYVWEVISKLQVSDRTEAVILARQRGLVPGR